MNIVICGGGIIGSSIAYYLAKQNVTCQIIEQEEIACAASGKAGGFLARNWCESKVCDDLAKFSFDLHMELAKEFTDVDYRNVNTYSACLDKLHTMVRNNVPEALKWIDGPVYKCSLMETTSTTAQVHPKKLTRKFMSQARKLTNNVTKVIQGTIVGIEFNDNHAVPVVTGVKLQSGQIIEANKIIIAMGPWTQKAMQWFPKGCVPKVVGHRAHSVILRAPRYSVIPPNCVFLQYHTSRGVTSPEIYPRPDGTVYISGYGDDAELPDKASAITIERWRCSQLRDIAYSTCSNLESSEVLAEQACFLPLSPDGSPVIGILANVEGAYIAAGHSCWGILNSTGTGYAMAELLTTGQSLSVDLKPFDPDRFIDDY